MWSALLACLLAALAVAGSSSANAQTSGGLLLAVRPDQAAALASVLRVQGLPAALIGEVVPGESGRIEVSQGPF